MSALRILTPLGERRLASWPTDDSTGSDCYGANRLANMAITNGSLRRIFLLAAHPSEGRFTQPIAVVQAWRPELGFMPRSRHP
jgi:hypothetical protein